jgi:oligosaccharide repeat unit polymerase
MIELALALNAVVFVALVIFLLSRGYLSLYSGLIAYLAFHFVVFVQRPILVYLFDLKLVFSYMRYWPSDEVFLQALVVANVGLFSFVFFYLVALQFRPLRPTFTVPAVTSADGKAFALAFALLSPVILYSIYLAFTMRQVYGIEVLDQLSQLDLTIDPATGNFIYANATAYVVEGRNFAFAFATFIILLYRGRWTSWLPLLAFAFISLQIGSRWPLVMAAVVLLLMTMYFRKRYTFTNLQWFVVGTVAVLFVAVGRNRDAFLKFLTTGRLEFDFDFSQSSFGDHPDFAMFDCLTYIIGKVPEVSHTYSYFTQYLGVFTQPIPRMLWPDKPVGSPIQLVNLEAYGKFAPFVTSLVGDGWISLGYVGVIITTGAVGAFYGWLYRRLCTQSPSVYFFCAYFWLDALALIWARDGGATTIPTLSFFCLSPFLLAYAIERLVFRGAGAPTRVRLQ